jgi:hypothetical protein
MIVTIIIFFFLPAILTAAYILFDSKKRGKTSWLLVLLSLPMIWWAVIPFHLAGRKLLPGETREGGYGWNVCKFLFACWTLFAGLTSLFTFFMIFYLTQDTYSKRESDNFVAFFSVFGMAGAMCVWIGMGLPVIIVGFILRKSSHIEKGEDVTTVPTQTTPPAPSSSAQSVQISVARQGNAIGTFDAFTFRRKLASGEILPTDHYWKQGMSGWDVVANYRG